MGLRLAVIVDVVVVGGLTSMHIVNVGRNVVFLQQHGARELQKRLSNSVGLLFFGVICSNSSAPNKVWELEPKVLG
jgi:hypothetical protein